MAIPFLNHLDLRSVSELQNAILHKTTSGSASDIEGAIIYDTGTDTIKYYSGSSGSGAWISLGAEAHSFKTISVAGQDDVVADATTDALTLVAGTNVSITTTASSDTITISSSDTNDNTQNVYDFDIASGTTKLTLTQSGHDGADTDQVEIAGSGSVTVTRDSSSKLTISGTDTNTDTLQSVSNSTSNAENFVTFVANASGAQTAGSDSTFVYIPSSETLKVKNLIVSGDTTTANETVKVVENNTLEFEGASGSGTDDELKLTTAVLSADRTITLPDNSGTVALTSDITGTNSGTNTGDQNLFKRINGDTGSEVAG